MAARATQFILLCFLLILQTHPPGAYAEKEHPAGRERISINTNWRFWRSEKNPDGITYDNRTDTPQGNVTYLRPWILPSANEFIPDASKQYKVPSSGPGINISYVQSTFDDSAWENVVLPHDWAIKGPFYVGNPTPITGGMGRLPSQGVGWYRRKLSVAAKDEGKVTYLDIDGAMSYAIVWLNGHLVGGWPFGYNSFRLDLTPYLKSGDDNLLAIRLDNPIDSSRWYPGGGIYRNVWLTKVEPVHVAHWGTYITTKDVSEKSATIDIVVQTENKGNGSQQVEILTDVHIYDAETEKIGEKVAEFPRTTIKIPAGKQSANASLTIQNPRLWGPPPTQKPNLYVAVTRLLNSNSKAVIDIYQTPFGVRSFTYSGEQGLLVNGKRIRIQGVNQHNHDLGALGSAWNNRAAERQLEKLRDLGVNAIRMAHNPPAPELLQLTDRMGFVVMDEIFDSWERKKTDNDFHLIFPEWHEADLRSFIRRDRNHASIYAWSVGNEVGEQTCCGERGYEIGRLLNDLVKDEDPTRPVTASMNVAKPNQSFPNAMDILSINYQGEGIRDTPQYAWTNGTRTPPQYKAFHDKFPNKLLAESESAAALSSRGTYLFPVTELNSAPVNNTNGGGNSTLYHVSAYELHSANFGSSVDKVFAAQDANPFVAGEFVWSGWDYLGEPEPYYDTRSSYFGIIDLAGFPKDRYYLYQSRWRPDLKIAHILPHWNWPDRVGKVTPVHVFTNGDEAELFLNGKSLGRQKLGKSQYRFRWNDVVYQPGQLRVVTYKKGQEWATSTVRTTGAAAKLRLTADRTQIAADGSDLSFITLEIVDSNEDLVRDANDAITFSTSGPGDIVATDNGFEADFTPFPSRKRNAFNGLALAIVKARKGKSGSITITASAKGLAKGSVTITA
ncbi:glycoside hydrolase family 2 protein [Cucurbitaria berberidis CBS 394.84]|uniref:Glycoside hydrolase family 2 protein n=1 Tax=Cucurbitaria berberidis CBS 394.84 TaxID=1168544 RepID=A0A9P4G975_9PLEO|nr:glycoside hydrolase family 2 protein [Cucurbitaria berberidis CBS 394.84]KAF1841458.1 glycoside hydrolase family 2 protein [Cucurbitaria berberidis CBS 394.84]